MNKEFLTVVGFVWLALGSMQAQTTLSGDHVIDGDLSVGTSANKSKLVVVGETGGDAAAALQTTGDGGVFFGGTFGVGKMPSLIGGSRFMWYPKKAALLVGEAEDLGDDDSRIGNYSVALGRASTAQGFAAFAVGEYAYASGPYSVAMGSQTGTGEDAYASMSFGEWCGAYGSFSLAFGFQNSAQGRSSVAFNAGNISFGDESVAMGNGVVAYTQASIAIGRFNAGVILGGDPNIWKNEDPVFEIGIGTGISTDPLDVRYRNAVTVYKNGKVEMNGDVRIAKRQGDILMGEFGNPE